MSSAIVSVEIWNGHDAHVARACMYAGSCQRHYTLGSAQLHGDESTTYARHVWRLSYP